MGFTLIRTDEAARMLRMLVCDGCRRPVGREGIILFGHADDDDPIASTDAGIHTARFACSESCRDFELALDDEIDAIAGTAPLAAYLDSLAGRSGAISVTPLGDGPRPRLSRREDGRIVAVPA